MSSRIAHALATWFGVGHLPKAPGTFGTLAAVPLALALAWAGAWWAVMPAAVVVTLLGAWAGGIVARETGLKDPQVVVIDEVAGYLLTCSFGPPGWRTAALAFVLFRVFDIWKPGPVQKLESLPGGWGVMADDLGAGLLAGVMTWLAFGLVAGHWRGAIP